MMHRRHGRGCGRSAAPTCSLLLVLCALGHGSAASAALVAQPAALARFTGSAASISARGHIYIATHLEGHLEGRRGCS